MFAQIKERAIRMKNRFILIILGYILKKQGFYSYKLYYLCDYTFLTSRDISNNEIEYLDKIIRLGIENEINSISNRLVSYDPTTLLQTKNFSYLKTSYTRVSSNNKPVYVERYMIYNNGCLINISVSSRVAEKETLFKDLWNCVNTIVLK